MSAREAKFSLGQLVRHGLFAYRGVVTDVDGSFQLSEEWYEQVARTRPPKDQPWYHVLVHDSTQMTYVAERNLMPDPEVEPIRHPLLAFYFDHFEGGRYTSERPVN
jgi:heat shock protein HspQ